jgi:integrase/recombinase XerD
MILHDALTGYWLDKRAALSPRTARDYELAYSRLLAFLGPDQPIAAVTADDIRRFLAAMRDEHNLSPKSVINLWIALSSFWSWVERELRLPHIVRGVARPTWHPPAIEPFTRVEISALLAECDQVAPWTTLTGRTAQRRARDSASRDRAIILTLLDTGLRASELTALQLRDLDERAGRLHIRHGKGDKSRYVFLGDTARRALWRYTAADPDRRPGRPLFITRTGRPMDTDALRNMLSACGKRAGVSNVHPHRFRHTFAITFLRNGGNLLELQAMLGHATLDTVRIYARLAQVDLQEAQKRASPADNWRL